MAASVAQAGWTEAAGPKCRDVVFSFVANSPILRVDSPGFAESCQAESTSANWQTRLRMFGGLQARRLTPAMITGCNTNIRHGDMVFHVQTEDSGRANPHIISHVYCGGTIVGSRKQDYSDAMESDDLDRVVRTRIEEQHKAMLKALRRGEFDEAIAERLADQPGSDTRPDSASPADSPSNGSTTGSVTAPQPDTDPLLGIELPPKSEKSERPSATASFGESVDTQKPLDEVILEYLVEKARERPAERRSAQKTRSKG